MSCPTCDHTMQLTEVTFWCPRCGTIKFGKTVTVPYLVKRCLDFAGELRGSEHADLIDQYRILGIEESIMNEVNP